MTALEVERGDFADSRARHERNGGAEREAAAPRWTDRAALALVLLVWLAMAVLAIDYVRRFASPIPAADDL
jgi:hypothetical protein